MAATGILAGTFLGTWAGRSWKGRSFLRCARAGRGASARAVPRNRPLSPAVASRPGYVATTEAGPAGSRHNDGDARPPGEDPCRSSGTITTSPARQGAIPVRPARSDSPLAALAGVRTPREAMARFKTLDPQRKMQLMTMFMKVRDAERGR